MITAPNKRIRLILGSGRPYSKNGRIILDQSGKAKWRVGGQKCVWSALVIALAPLVSELFNGKKCSKKKSIQNKVWQEEIG